MEVKRNADIPMSAMWTPRPGATNEQFGYNADIRESASVVHIYGQNLVAAESLSVGQRVAIGNCLEKAAPSKRDRSIEAGCRPTGNQSDQLMGESADRRPAAQRDQEIHLHDTTILSSQFTVTTLRIIGASAGYQVRVVSMSIYLHILQHRSP